MSSSAISGIIYGIASGGLLPEELVAMNNKVLTHAPAASIRSKLLLEKALSIYSVNDLFERAVQGSYGKRSTFVGLSIVEDKPATYAGVQDVLEQLLGCDINAVQDQTSMILERIDPKGTGKIDENQFEQLLHELKQGSEDAPGDEEIIKNSTQMQRTQHMFGRGSLNRNSSMNQHTLDVAVKRYLKGDDKFGAKNWSMLYCGGSSAILSQLKDYKRKYGIGLAVEKFDW